MTGGGSELVTSTAGRRFLIHSCLGRGGFGEVYRATMTSTGGVRTEVAVKVLRADIDPGSDSVKRLRDEGRLLGALSHPAILKVHDLVLLEGRVALVTEFVEGEDLDSCLAAEPPLPLRALVGVVGEVGSALDVAWNAPSPQLGARGPAPMHLVHRDVKPANVRLGRHGEVKLLDFGIARATNLDREAHTANNAMLGSYLYMAPERFHEEKVEPPSDVYALGCVLFEGLTQHRLFDGMTLKQIYGVMLLSRKYNSHIEERFQLVSAATPPPVMDLLRNLLDVDPSLRPTAGQLARLCEDLAESLGGVTLKRWARARDWPPQPHIAGTLDGRDLSAESFDAPLPEPSRPIPSPIPSPILSEPPPVLSAPRAAPEEPLDLTIETQKISIDRAPRAAPADLSFAAILTIGAGEGLDAPISGIVSREMIRPSPDELEKLKREGGEDPLPPASVRISKPVTLPPRPMPIASVSSQTITPGPLAVPAPAPVAESAMMPPRTVSSMDAVVEYEPTGSMAQAPTRGPDTGFTDNWFINKTPLSNSVSPAPLRPLGPKMAAPPTPAGVGVERRSGPVNVDTEIPLAPEPIPGVFDDEEDRNLEHIVHLRRVDAGRRQRAALWAVIGMTAIGLALVGALGLWVADKLADKLEALPPEGRDADGGLDVRPAPPAPAVEAPVPVEALPQVPVEAPPAPVPAVVPLPPPAPAKPAPAKPPPKPAPPKPAPAKPAPPERANVGALVTKGWKVIDSNPKSALSLFDQVIAADPKSPEGYYGRGYALANLSRRDESVSAFCKGIGLAPSKLANEIRGVMTGKGLSCP